MRHLFHLAQKVKTREDFVEFLQKLSEDFDRDNSDWANRSIDSYLEAISAYCESYDVIPELPSSWKPSDVNWGFCANLMWIGKIYE